MDWQSVFETHRTFSGVAIHGGRITSVLAGNDRHRDDFSEGSITYEVPKSRGYVWVIKKLNEAFQHSHKFTVFQKVDVNDWRDLGLHEISSAEETERLVIFALVPTKESKANAEDANCKADPQL